MKTPRLTNHTFALDLLAALDRSDIPAMGRARHSVRAGVVPPGNGAHGVTRPTLKRWLALCFLASVLCLSARAQGTAFTYQGRLTSGTNVANGSYDLKFTLYDTNQPAGNLIAGPLTNSATAVSNGLFSVALNFGSVFPGADRWLEIGVRTNGGGAFTTLAGRQRLTAAPYAITASNLSGTLPAAQLSGVMPSAQLAGTYGNAVTLNNAANSFTGNGTGLTNVNAATLGGLGSSNFWKTAGNAGANPTNGAFLGTTDNLPLEFKVNGERALRIEPNPGYGAVNIIGGSLSNVLDAGVVGATIHGGGATNYFGAVYPNRVSADFGTVGGGVGNTSSGHTATVGGGAYNTASEYNATVGGGYQNNSSDAGATVGGGYQNTAKGFATVGGGYFNNASGGYATVGGGSSSTASGDSATVGGGGQNTASGYAATVGGGDFNTGGGDIAAVGGGGHNTASRHSATVGGGAYNTASGIGAFVGGGGYNGISYSGNTASGAASTVAGGLGNTASGIYATVPGGDQNVATNNSFAAGHRAKASHIGSFVWADSTEANFATTSSNQFLIRATGGVGIGSTEPLGVLEIQGGADSGGDNDPKALALAYRYGGYRHFIRTRHNGGSAAGNGIDFFLNTSNTAAGSSAPGTGNVLSLSVNATGVGIGTTSPNGQLEVSGASAEFAPPLQVNDSGSRGFSVIRMTMGDDYSKRWDVAASTNAFVIYSGVFGANMLLLDSAGLTVRGTFVSSSDRNEKQDLAPVDPRAVLEKVTALPVSEWSYKQDRGTRHVGPMAQDFRAAFGLGTDDKHIATVDEGGVALAAIQGLNQKLTEELQRRDTENANLKQRLEKLERLMNQNNGGVK